MQSASSAEKEDVGEIDQQLKAVSDEAESKKLKKVLILLSDTGGGHRASAGALKDALLHTYGVDSLQVTILDIWTDYGSWPFNSFVAVYRFASENPWCWRMLYQSSRSPITRSLFFSSGYAVSGANFGRVFRSLNPDLVISVHPLCQHVPLQIMAELERINGTSAPFVTIVTDLGACHPTWFHPRANRVYVPSQSIKTLAMMEGVKPSRTKLIGLPLRESFWRHPEGSKEDHRTELNFEKTWKTCLVVGGGEGVGGLDDIAVCIIEAFLRDDKYVMKQISAVTSNPVSSSSLPRNKKMHLVVVCGKNEQTRQRVIEEIKNVAETVSERSRRSRSGDPNWGRVIVEDRSEPFTGPGCLEKERKKKPASRASRSQLRSVKPSKPAAASPRRAQYNEKVGRKTGEITGGECKQPPAIRLEQVGGAFQYGIPETPRP